MKKEGTNSNFYVFIYCFLLLFLVAGCTTTKNLVSYLKFWSPRGDVDTTVVAQKEDISPAQIRPALMRGNPDSHYALGQHLQQRGKHREAIEEFTKTVKIDPMYAKAYDTMGISYDFLGEHEKATKCYEQALDLSPTGEHYNNLGYNLVLKGEYVEAVEMLKTAMVLDPANDKIKNNLALAYSNMGQYDLALNEIQNTREPGDNRLALAQVLLNTGKVFNASDYVSQVSEMDPVFEAKLTENDQFVIKMARLINQPDDSKLVQNRGEKPVGAAVDARKIVRELKTVKKDSVMVKKAKTEAPKPSARVAYLYSPDFMFNKEAKDNRSSDYSQKTKSEQKPTVQLINQLFPVQHASERDLGSPVIRTLGL